MPWDTTPLVVTASTVASAVTATDPRAVPAGQVSAANWACEHFGVAFGLPSRPGGNRTMRSLTSSELGLDWNEVDVVRSGCPPAWVVVDVTLNAVTFTAAIAGAGRASASRNTSRRPVRGRSTADSVGGWPRPTRWRYSPHALRDSALRRRRRHRDDHAEPARPAEHDRPADARRDRGRGARGGRGRRREGDRAARRRPRLLRGLRLRRRLPPLGRAPDDRREMGPGQGLRVGDLELRARCRSS